MARRGGGGGKIPQIVESTVKRLFKKGPDRTPGGAHVPGGGSTPAGSRSAQQIRDAGNSRVPSTWGDGAPNKKGVGYRWQDPDNPGNRVRVDQGNPNNSQPTQQIDHVQVNSNGRVLGRDGNPIEGTVKDNYDQAHVPLDEWLGWTDWNRP